MITFRVNYFKIKFFLYFKKLKFCCIILFNPFVIFRYVGFYKTLMPSETFLTSMQWTYDLVFGKYNNNYSNYMHAYISLWKKKVKILGRRELCDFVDWQLWSSSLRCQCMFQNIACIVTTALPPSPPPPPRFTWCALYDEYTTPLCTNVSPVGLARLAKCARVCVPVMRAAWPGEKKTRHRLRLPLAFRTWRVEGSFPRARIFLSPFALPAPGNLSEFWPIVEIFELPRRR